MLLDFGEAAGHQRCQYGSGLGIRLAVMSGGPKAHLEGGYHVAQGIGLAGAGAGVVAEALQAGLEPGQRRCLPGQQVFILGNPGGIRPDCHTGLGQLLPGEQRPRIELALRGDVAVPEYPLRRQAVTLQYVLQQRDQPFDLLRVPGIPLPALLGIPVAGVDYLDTDGAGIQPAAALPAAVPGMPGAALFIHQSVDSGWLVVDQVMAADLAPGQGIQRPAGVGRGVVQDDVLHPAVLPTGLMAGIDTQPVAAGGQQQADREQTQGAQHRHPALTHYWPMIGRLHMLGGRRICMATGR